MVELSLRSGKDDRDKTIAGKLDEWGVHAYTDRDFFDRRQNIETEIEGYLSDTDIAAMGLTKKRELLLKQAMKKFKFVWYHSASGKGAENPRFYKAMAACRNILLRVEESIDCDASDDDVYLNGRDRLAAMDKIIVATFGTENTTIMKSFVVQAPAPNSFQPQGVSAASDFTGRTAPPSNMAVPGKIQR